MKSVACVGILVADVIVKSVKEYPEKGLLLPVNSITVHSGGNAMTASINLTRYGVPSSIIGKVGNDLFGEHLRNVLKDKGVSTQGLTVDKETQTSASVLMIDSESGERSFFHCVGANAAFSIDDIDFDIIESSDIVFVTGTFLLKTFDGEQTMAFLKKCKEMGKTTVLDVCWDSSGKWGEILNCCMPYIDFFLPSINEAEELSGKKDVEEMARTFIKNGVGTVVIKCGEDGAFCKTSAEKSGVMIPAFKADRVMDTTGAGDNFCSGFLAAYARGLSAEKCAEIGNAAGSYSVGLMGAATGTISYEELLNKYGIEG